jgi:hypothetical protein
VTGGVGGTGEGSIDVGWAVDIKEEGSVKFDAVYIKDEIPETSTCPPIKTEQEVMLWVVCEVGAVNGFLPFIAPKLNLLN